MDRRADLGTMVKAFPLGGGREIGMNPQCTVCYLPGFVVFLACCFGWTLTIVFVFSFLGLIDATCTAVVRDIFLSWNTQEL